MSVCASCNAEITPGVRWCPICHINTVDQKIGRLASPGKRLMAYVFDMLSPAFILCMFVLGIFEETVAVFMIVVLLAYVVVSLILFCKGMTIGKKLVGICVVKEEGQRATFLTMLVREVIGKVISSLVLYLGFLWILFDSDRQGWHDKLASTFVVSDYTAGSE